VDYRDMLSMMLHIEISIAKGKESKPLFIKALT